MAFGIIVKNTTVGLNSFLPAGASGTILVSDPSQPLGLQFTSGSSGGGSVAQEQTWSVSTDGASNANISGEVILDLENASGSAKNIKIIRARVSVQNNITSGNIPVKTALVRTGGGYVSGVAITPIPFDISNASLPAQITSRQNSNGSSISGALAALGVGARQASPTVDPVEQVYTIYQLSPGTEETPPIVRPNQGVAIRIIAGPTSTSLAFNIEGEIVFTVA